MLSINGVASHFELQCKFWAYYIFQIVIRELIQSLSIVSLLMPFWLCQLSSLAAQEKSIALQEPYHSQYTKANATGKHVLGLWTFDGTNPGEDLSGNKHQATFEGATIEQNGKYGPAMRSYPGFPIEDKRHYAYVKDAPKLSPPGAFTIEMWISPGEDFAKASSAFLVDKKYVSDTDYQLYFMGAGRNGTRTLHAKLGFGSFSESWYSSPLKLKTGTWYHVAFLYNGAGRGRFFINGIPRGENTKTNAGSVAPGSRPLTIGDRNGSNYGGFPGLIDQVRISSGELEFRPIRFERVSERSAYVRMEPDRRLKFQVINLQRQPVKQATVNWLLNGVLQGRTDLSNLQAGKPQEILFPLDTRLRPDQYALMARLETKGPSSTKAEATFPIEIVPRKLPDQFPVIMWGAGLNEIDRLKKIGFTHAAGISTDYGKVLKAGQPTLSHSAERVKVIRDGLDRGLANGISFYAGLSPGSYLRNREEFLRVNRDGSIKSGRHDICPHIPAIKKFCYNVGVSVAETYQDYPAFESALLHTEVRGHSQPCFHPHDMAAFKEYAGIEVPKEVTSPYGVDYRRIKDFPKDRVIKDDNPLYVYYRWQWKTGDGWNDLNSDLHRGLTSTNKKIWTWYDPAMRVPTTFGSGGHVNVLSHWTYTYPDPIRINVVLDEMLAMAKGSQTNQDVMKMTQIIWYRSQTAPRTSKPDQKRAYRAAWEQEQPEAAFITISPMHLREAFWAKISRPIKGIMYHGWQSLVPTETKGAYRYTHPQTVQELQRLIQNVVRPLGPAMKNIPPAKNDIAYYESFAAQVFARRGTLGWNGYWLGDAHQLMQWAGLQADVVFDESIEEFGLDQYNALVMMDCDVITDSILKQVKAFQQKGGLIIADEKLTPSLTPDIKITSSKRTGNAYRDKEQLLAKAKELRDALKGKYRKYVDSSNPNVVHYTRRGKSTDYIFVVNDHREYGKYVGHHGRVMENALPSEAKLTIQRSGGHLYDLVHHQPVHMNQSGDLQTTSVRLGPASGGIYMLTKEPIERVHITVPKALKRGEAGTVTLQVTDAQNRPIEAVIPVEVVIQDAEGRLAEQSGYRAVINGKESFQLEIAPNDVAGSWRVEVRELASGKRAAADFRVSDEGSVVKPSGRLIEGYNPVQPAG